MHDIDAQISKITGQNNYMETLQKITGNIMNVDVEMYRNVHKKVSACDFNLKVLLSRLVENDPDNSTIKGTADEFINESNQLNIKDGTFVMYQRKCKSPKPPREIIDHDHLPSELLKTKWFKSVKHIEKEVNKFYTAVFPATLPADQQTFEYLNNTVYTNTPEVKEIQSVYDVHILTAETFKSIEQLRKCANIIINQLLVPMYDVKGTIRKHWHKIQKVFTTKAFQSSGIASPEDIIDMLYQFIVAKYRATVTGNNKHYAKLFLSVVGDKNVSNIDGARFIEIMDSIDLDKLDKNENVYKFATSAKEIIHSIVNNDNINAKEVIEKLNASFGIGDEDEQAPTTTADGESTEGVDGETKPSTEETKYDDVDPSKYSDLI